jgi:glycosyltransferase involved in cell wall biosynthesis
MGMTTQQAAHTADVMPAVSVIICTRNRANALRSSLDSVGRAIKSAAPIPVQLVVVDNGSTDGTSDVVRSWANEVDVPVTLVFEKRPGLATARNAGVRGAKGEILAFTDDDCQMAETYISLLLEEYARHTGPVIIGGRVDLGDPADLPMTIKTDAEPAEFDGHNVGSFLIGANLTMSRAAWNTVGEMDERFGAGTALKASEETDYLYRAFLAKIPLLYRPQLRVLHFHGRRTQSDVKQLWRDYSIGNGALFAKHFGKPIVRHFRWNCKNALKELLGVTRPAPPLRLSYIAMVRGNMRGFLLYWMQGRGHTRA